MRLSVCLPMFFKKEPITDAIKTVSELGYDAVEMWKVPDGTDLEAVATACKKHGVEFIAICTDYFSMTSESDRAPYLDGLRSACEKAKALEVKKLISQVGPDTLAQRSIQHNNVVSCLKAAVPIIEEYGVTLVIEPLNTLVDHIGYYLWSSAEGFEIIREVDSPNVKLLFDIYHQQVMEGNIIANITENIDLIGHLHSAGCPGRNELQSGENDYKVIFNAIDKTDYNGVCALEYKPLLPPLESLKLTKELYG